jgi:predicted transcriptional regulator
MDEVTPDMPTDNIELTADIVSAYVSKNSVPVTELANLLASVHAALSGLASDVLILPRFRGHL